MKNLCKVHPNMNQFLEENIYGVSKVKELANKACQIYISLIEVARTSEAGTADRIAESELKDFLTPHALDILSTANRYFDKPNRCSECGEYAKVNIYGFLKLGERSVNELETDMKNHFTHNERLGSTYFDVESCIQVGFKIAPFVSGTRGALTSFNDDRPVFDVSAILVRALNNATAVVHNEEVEKAILTAMVSRLVVMFGTHKELMCLVDNCLKMKYSHGAGMLDEERSKTTDLREILKTLFIYKVWYNGINDLNDVCLEKSVENILDLVNLASRSFNATQAIPDVFNTIHSKIMSGVMDVERFPDRVIRECMDYYRKAMNYYGFREDNGRRMHAAHIKGKAVIGVESFAFESFLSTIGVTRGFRDKKRASLTFLGFENMNTSTREFDEWKKKSRGAILAKLKSDERNTYIQYESDVMKFRAEAIGCRNVYSQSTILKRGETIAKLISMELSKEHTEEFVTMMGMLDAERLAVQTELANRDFYRERTTMLNGQLGSLKDEWTY